MSNPIQSNGTASSLFQSHFGTPPGGQDAKAECKNWERLCDELLAERVRLKSELEKARLEAIFKEWDAEPKLTMEEIYAQVDRTTSMEQIIADLEKQLEEER